MVAWLYNSVAKLMVEGTRAEKYAETALSLTVDDVFGNDWWYAFNINFCFGCYVDVATLYWDKTRGWTGG
jgi:hypothetical protein